MSTQQTKAKLWRTRCPINTLFDHTLLLFSQRISQQDNDVNCNPPRGQWEHGSHTMWSMCICHILEGSCGQYCFEGLDNQSTVSVPGSQCFVLVFQSLRQVNLKVKASDLDNIHLFQHSTFSRYWHLNFFCFISCFSVFSFGCKYFYFILFECRAPKVSVQKVFGKWTSV